MANKAAVKTLMTAPIMAAVMASRSVKVGTAAPDSGNLPEDDLQREAGGSQDIRADDQRRGDCGGNFLQLGHCQRPAD